MGTGTAGDAYNKFAEAFIPVHGLAPNGKFYLEFVTRVTPAEK
jgi:hypothetical protein